MTDVMDRTAVFGEAIGISLMSPCTFRFRRKKGDGWERASLTAESRSAYLLQGPSRTEWAHSIPASIAGDTRSRSARSRGRSNVRAARAAHSYVSVARQRPVVDAFDGAIRLFLRAFGS
jgi:hypothetical protein